ILFAYGPESPLPTILQDPQTGGGCKLVDGLAAPLLRRSLRYDERGGKFIEYGGDKRPRRIWDICANRVVPTTWFPTVPFVMAPMGIVFTLENLITPVSHAWVAPEDLEFVLSHINHGLWPLPIPRGTNLNHVRHELIQRNIRYTWLDVLCLRQNALGATASLSGLAPISDRDNEVIRKREELRMTEWETDIPLIGSIYEISHRVFVYLSGLGRPFQDEHWDHKRHWTRRVWTLQETKDHSEMIIGGLNETEVDPWMCKVDKHGRTLRQVARSALFETGSFTRILNLKDLVRVFQYRSCSNEIDRVAALLYIIMHAESADCGYYWPESHEFKHMYKGLPLYYPHETASDGWARFVGLTSRFSNYIIRHCPDHICADGLYLGSMATQLLSVFPYPSADHWFPSWAQVMQYPDVSVCEAQSMDTAPPPIDLSLKIIGGRLYRGVRLALGKDASGRPTHYNVYALVESRGIEKPASQQKLCAIGSPTLPNVDISPDHEYIIIDITPIRIDIGDHKIHCPEHGPAFADRSGEPMWAEHLLIVCRELSSWPSTQLEPISDPSTRLPLEYRLRRITSLGWKSAINTSGKPEHSWLPFEAALQTRVETFEHVVRGGRTTSYRAVLWDSRIDVRLQ
ncbi:hypothetical protein L211DRAFT_639696, partial [Terfezia boudieri ATCC MYA-4762]